MGRRLVHSQDYEMGIKGFWRFLRSEFNPTGVKDPILEDLSIMFEMKRSIYHTKRQSQEML